MKRPASQYYWGDWRRDTALQACSLAARGLWHEMNCLMHDCDPYGHLCVGATAMQPSQLARLVGITPKECSALLAELDGAGVFSRTAEGVIYSRRMVRDEDLRERRANGGKAGAEHGVKGAEHGAKGGRPNATKGGLVTPLQHGKEPPPASASASASAENGGIPPEPPARKRAREAGPPDQLPGWVDATAWEGYEAMRKAARKPMTPAARRLAVAELAKLRDAGHDPTEVLRQSTFRSWVGLFPLKPETVNGHVGAMSEHGMQTMRNAKALEARLFGAKEPKEVSDGA